MLSSLLCLVAPRAVLGLRSSNAPPCLSVRLGAGRDVMLLSSSPVRLAAVACLGVGCLQLFLRLRRPVCLLGLRGRFALVL